MTKLRNVRRSPADGPVTTSIREPEPPRPELEDPRAGYRNAVAQDKAKIREGRREAIEEALVRLDAKGLTDQERHIVAEGFMASVKPGHVLSDREREFLLELLRPRVASRARKLTAEAPKGIEAEDLYGVGWGGWALAYETWQRDGGNFFALGEVVAERRMIDELRRLLSPLKREGFATSIDPTDLDHKRRKQAEAAMPRHNGQPDPGSEDGFAEHVASKMDLMDALRTLHGDDYLVTMILALADGRVFELDDPRLIEAIRGLLAKNANDPRKVVAEFYPVYIPQPDGTTVPNPRWLSTAEIEEHLQRAGRFIRAKLRFDNAPGFLERVVDAFGDASALGSRDLAGKLGISPKDLAVEMRHYGIKARKHHGRMRYLAADLPSFVSRADKAWASVVKHVEKSRAA